MKPFRISAGLSVVLVAAACSFYRSQPKMEYFHGQNVPAGYIQVVRATENEVTFRILVKFNESHLYHLILQDNEPLAQGWFPVRLVDDSQSYSVTLSLNKGLKLERGKTYRLCIGGQNPEAVQLQSSSYRCLVDYEFVFEEKQPGDSEVRNGK